MNKRFFVIGICILAFLLLGNNTCELISFGGGEYPIDIIISNTFTVDVSGTHYEGEHTENLGDLYGDEITDMDLITEAYLSYAILTVISSNLPANTLVEDTIWFQGTASPGWKSLATFNNLDITDLLQTGRIISPIDEVLPLMTMNATNVAELNRIIDPTRTAPASISFKIEIDANNSPVEFVVDMDIAIQVVVTSE